MAHCHANHGKWKWKSKILHNWQKISRSNPKPNSIPNPTPLPNTIRLRFRYECDTRFNFRCAVCHLHINGIKCQLSCRPTLAAPLFSLMSTYMLYMHTISICACNTIIVCSLLSERRLRETVKWLGTDMQIRDASHG